MLVCCKTFVALGGTKYLVQNEGESFYSWDRYVAGGGGGSGFPPVLPVF